MSQGQEEPHDKNQILKREIGEAIIHNNFFSLLIVIYLPDGLICSITHLLFEFYKYLIFSTSSQSLSANDAACSSVTNILLYFLVAN